MVAAHGQAKAGMGMTRAPKLARKRSGNRSARQYNGGPITLMAVADGYVTVRRPYCTPFVLSVKEFERLEVVEREIAA